MSGSAVPHLAPTVDPELEEGASSPLQPLISSRSTLSVERQSLGSPQEQQAWAGGKAAALDGGSAAAARCPGPRDFAWVSEHVLWLPDGKTFGWPTGRCMRRSPGPPH